MSKTLKYVQSSHDLSHFNMGSGHLGRLYPVYHQYVPCRTRLQIQQACDIMLEPTIRPLRSPISATLHTFGCPVRLLWKNPTNADDCFEKYITNADSTLIPPYLSLDLAANPSNSLSGSVLDYLNIPIEYRRTSGSSTGGSMPAIGDGPKSRISALFARAYYFIYDEWYKHSLYQQCLNNNNRNGGAQQVTPTQVDSVSAVNVRHRNWSWRKDYFARSVPSSQQGSAVSITGAVTPRDLTSLFQLQIYKERNQYGGIRLKEWYQTHYGVSPRDERLQRPEYYGGGHGYISMPEVLQTSQTTTGDTGSALATRAGLGRGLIASHTINQFFPEDTIVITMLSVMPDGSYSQGIEQQMQLNSITDFVIPEFTHLGMQPIKRSNLSCNLGGSAAYDDIIGFVNKYEHFRVRNSYYCGEMRPEANINQAYWHLGRNFGQGAPQISATFFECRPDEARTFAVPSRDTIVWQIYNRILGSFPIPKVGEPGLIDHF